MINNNHFVFILLVLTGYVSSLRITKVTVPSPMIVGENGFFECQWNFEGARVYTLKWYLGLHEFYRWTPSANPTKQRFKIEKAFAVDLVLSNAGRVHIQNVTLKAAGLLRCEISLEAPEFHTEFKDANLTVVDLPDSRPMIRIGGKMGRMTPREVVLNCSSPEAKPAAALSVYINDEQAPKQWVIHYPTYVNPRTFLETSNLGLRFPLLERYTNRGYVEVRCVAQLNKVYYEVSEVVVAGTMPSKASVAEAGAKSVNIVPIPKKFHECPSSIVILLQIIYSIFNFQMFGVYNITVN